MLPIEYWHIDFQRKCVVPKTNVDHCYDKEVDYDDIENHINYIYNFNDLSTTKCGEEEAHDCPHYVSVCYKTN